MMLDQQYVGLGMYPDQTCFDADRPGWLPYWLDDLTESRCKVNLVVTGNTTGNTGTASTGSADDQTVTNERLSCIKGGGSWDDANNVCQEGLVQRYGMTAILVGGAVAAVVGLAIVNKLLR